MKANELMIGDWVSVRQLCSGILCQNSNIKIDAIHLLDFVENLDNPLIEPIPITDEILKANGFIREGGTSWNRKCHVNIQHWSKDNMVLNGTGKHGNPINIPDIVYVHELQHALRFCGLNELADNFVIGKGRNNDD